MPLRSIVALALLLLASAPACAQVHDLYEQPRNRIALPVAEPVAVDIYLPQDGLYALDASGQPAPGIGPNMGAIGGLGYGIGSIIQNRQNKRDELVASSLQGGMPVITFDTLLLQAFERHVGPAQLASIKRVTFHHDTPSAVEKATPGDPEETTLALTVRYYLSTNLRDLRVVMGARLGPRRVVTALPGGKQGPDFSQVLVYDIPGNLKMFANRDSRESVWAQMGPEAAAGHLRAGIDGVMAMLPVELARKPRIGRIPGRQIPWQDNMQTATYGAMDARLADRVLVRLRSGILVSLPADDSRLPEGVQSLPDVTPATSAPAASAN